MPRPEKVQAVAELRERFENARAVFLAEYAGLSVKAQQELRRGLRESGAEFKVAKMTLTRLATADLGVGGLDELLIGPTGLAFADVDAVAAAKVLDSFAAENEALKVKGGLLGADLLTPERVTALAKLPGRQELLAKILATAKAPLSNMAGLLGAMPRNAASLIQQLIEKRQAAGEESPAVADSAEDTADDSTTQEDPAEEPTTDDTASEVAADEAAPEVAADEAAPEVAADEAAPEVAADEAASDEASEEPSQEQEESAAEAEEE
jgi:large subunit ribosomal protein L10